jgi:murein DD-endopeptidase MepM/ murein hydrolase activator NlpD
MSRTSRTGKHGGSYTLMFIPDDNGKPFSLHVNRRLFKPLLIFLLLTLGGMIVLVVKSGEIALRLQLLNIVSQENHRLKEENARLSVLKKRIDDIEEYAKYIDRLATITRGNPSLPSHASMNEKFDKKDTEANTVSDTVLSAPRATQESEVTQEMISTAIPNIMPVDGWLTKGFTAGKGDDAGHPGIDIAAAQGFLIRATAPGTVDAVRYDKYFGNIVIIRHGFGFESRYGHCSQILVSRGDPVERGQSIALVGNTGHSSGPHLHYEIVRNGKPVDPMIYMLIRNN